MSFSGLSFWFWRIFEIITLIPIVGMLAWFVDYFTNANQLTPRSILILFIVATLAAAWAVGTLILYARAKHSANFVAFVDLLFVGAFIGAVYEMRKITNSDCSHFEGSTYVLDGDYIRLQGNYPELVTNKHCAMQKASFALGIINCILFFITFFFALFVHRHHDRHDRKERVVTRETRHYSHRGHRSPRRSHHSSRRSTHVV